MKLRPRFSIVSRNDLYVADINYPVIGRIFATVLVERKIEEKAEEKPK